MKLYRFILFFLLLATLSACWMPQRALFATPQPAAITHTPTIAATAILPSPIVNTSTPTLTATPTQSPTPTPTPSPLVASVITIPAPSLQGNLLGDAEEQAVQIILPASYAASPLRYPVVYFLPGFGSATDGNHHFYPTDRLASLMAGGQIKEMILVVPTGANRMGGSFYVNSPVSGNWEDFIIKDVVGYIDTHYRTIPSAAGRAIGGHSMGGFGAINLAMRHPDIFSVVYALSPGLFDETGLRDTYMFDTESKIRAFLLTRRWHLAAMLPQAALAEMSTYEGALQFTLAYGMAFAPNPGLPAPFLDYPFEIKDGGIQRIPQVWNRWKAGLGEWPDKVEQYHANLAQLKGIVIDYGENDRFTWIPRGCEYLAQVLASAKINYQIFHFNGTHNDQIPERLVAIMLPFFNQVLSNSQPVQARR